VTTSIEWANDFIISYFKGRDQVAGCGVVVVQKRQFQEVI